MKKIIKITTCLFPSEDGNCTGVAEPKIEGMQCITTSVIKISNKHYEQFEFIPNDLDLCCGGNAKRKGNFIHILNKDILPGM